MPLWIRMETYFQDYLTMLRVERNVSPQTLDAYERDVGKYLSFLVSQNVSSLDSISQMHIREYIRSLNAAGLSPASVARNFSSIKTYHKYLSAENLVKNNPTLVLSNPKIPKKLPDVLSVADVEAIIEAIELDSQFGIRDRAIIEILYSCGLRVSETCDLKIANLFLDDDSSIEPNWVSEHIKCIDYFCADISSGVSFSVVGDKIPENYSYFRFADQLDTGNVLIKRTVFEKCGLFDEQFEKMRMGDGEFGVRAYLNGFKAISNPNANRIHFKHFDGGLRELGTWDAFRSTNIFQPKPVPSVLYYWRKYWGNEAALISSIIILPTSFTPYREKGKKSGKLLSIIFFLVFLPFVYILYFLAWKKSSNMLKTGHKIDKL